MSSPTLIRTTLPELADKINEEHRAAEAALNDGLQHALQAGQLLLQAKALCPHGDWQPWLQDNFSGAQRTARAYMLVAQRWPAIEAKRQRVATLSLREALRLTAPPKPAPATEEALFPVDDAFLATIPELSPDRKLFALDPDDKSYYIEIHPSHEYPAHYYVLHYRDLDTAAGEVVYTRRPGRFDRRLLANILEHVNGIKPTWWLSEPADGREPWFVEADKTSRAGRFRPTREHRHDRLAQQ